MDVSTPEFAGILLGDGQLSIYRTHAKEKIKFMHFVKITLDSREEQYAQYIKNLMTDLFGRSPLIRKRIGQNAVDIRLTSKTNVLFLHNIGFALSPKWNRAIIPKQFITPELELFVVRGYFDTDGSVVVANNNGTIYPRLEMKISPSPMQAQFIDILKRRGFHFGVYQIGKGKVRVQLNGRDSLRKWYDEIGFSNYKHLKKAEAFL